MMQKISKIWSTLLMCGSTAYIYIYIYGMKTRLNFITPDFFWYPHVMQTRSLVFQQSFFHPFKSFKLSSYKFFSSADIFNSMYLSLSSSPGSKCQS